MEFEVSPLGGGYVGLQQPFEYLGPAWGGLLQAQQDPMLEKYALAQQQNSDGFSVISHEEANKFRNTPARLDFASLYPQGPILSDEHHAYKLKWVRTGNPRCVALTAHPAIPSCYNPLLQPVVSKNLYPQP